MTRGKGRGEGERVFLFLELLTGAIIKERFQLISARARVGTRHSWAREGHPGCSPSAKSVAASQDAVSIAMCDMSNFKNTTCAVGNEKATLVLFMGDSIARQMSFAFRCRNEGGRRSAYLPAHFFGKRFDAKQVISRYESASTLVLHTGNWYVGLADRFGSGVALELFDQHLSSLFRETAAFCSSRRCVITTLAAEHWPVNGTFSKEVHHSCVVGLATCQYTNMDGLRPYEHVGWQASRRTAWIWKPILNMTASWRVPGRLSDSDCDCVHFCYKPRQWAHMFAYLGL